MRQIANKQQPLMPNWGSHQHSRELAMISTILDENPDIAQIAHEDLIRGKNSYVGRDGMTGEQVVRVALIKQIHSLSYRDLAFHLGDSSAFRTFVRLPFGTRPPHSTLQSNVKQLRPQTWEAINGMLVRHAKAKKIEKGRKIRTDCTVVDSNIHKPTDSSLLWDCVRVITRLLYQVSQSFPMVQWVFSDHTRRAKRRAYEIAFPSKRKKKCQRKKHYRDLLKVTEKAYSYGRDAEAHLRNLNLKMIDDQVKAECLADDLKAVLDSAQQVIDQTRRRVFHGEKVPVDEKLVSIFETHTDIIVKDRRETLFGHKVCLTGGASSMILDCFIEQGNPADTSLVEKSIQRQIALYGRPPRQASYDGGFGSQDNVKKAKGLGVKDIAFHKKRGLQITDMVKSAWVFKRLRNFRAGIEGCISTLKRAFQMDRCLWRGFESFQSYVWISVVSFNLVVFARHLLA